MSSLMADALEADLLPVLKGLHRHYGDFGKVARVVTTVLFTLAEEYGGAEQIKGPVPFIGTEEELHAVLVTMYQRYDRRWRLVQDAITDAVTRIIGDEDDPPHSVPFNLTDEQRGHVREALFRLYEQLKTWAVVAKEVGYPRRFTEAFNRGTVAGSTHFAARVAEAMRVKLDDLLAGKVHR